MSDPFIKQKIEKLKEEIRKHEYLYYVLNSPQITDAEFDKLMNELKSLEEKYPDYITLDSPTQRVGGTASSEFKPVKHTLPMLSLDNCYSQNEFIKWYNRIEKTIGKNFEMLAEAKIDGLSCSIEYENGILKRASTRGDGEIGEDITLNVKTIKSVPLKINMPENSAIEIRGEVYMDKKDFLKLNLKQIDEGETPFSNPRNAASGSLRQKDPKVSALRNLKFMAHSYAVIEGIKKPETQIEYLELCEKLRIPTNSIRKLCLNIEDVLKFYEEIEKSREKLDFEIDGIVIKVNSFEQQKILGFTAKSPKWAIAFKFKAHQAKTKLENVIFSVGRTGIITPIAKLTPVKCGGVIISSSTLHNFDEIKRLGIKISDTVIVERAGDVIPKISRVVIEERTGNEKDIEIPYNCPSCGAKLFKESNEVYIRCINPNCPQQIKRNILHFASRNAMNIEGMGESTVDGLIDKNIIRKLSDIYNLKKEDLFKLDLFKDKKADNLIFQIERSKKQNLDKLIYALGIRHVGEKTAKILAQTYKDITKLMKANKEELSNINEIGPVIAESIYNFFSQNEIVEMIESLKKSGVNTIYHQELKNKKLEGLTFVFTGELNSMTRTEAQKMVEELGGKTSSSVSPKTSYVVVGINPGSKSEKAKKIGVKIINEEEFIKLIGLK